MRTVQNEIAQKSYHLFPIVMQAPISLAYSQEKWSASHLTMYGAYKWERLLPWVGDPQDIPYLGPSLRPCHPKRPEPGRAHSTRVARAGICFRTSHHRGLQALRSHRAFLRPRYLLRVQRRQTVPASQGRPILPPYDRRQTVQHPLSDHGTRSDEELVR